MSTSETPKLTFDDFQLSEPVRRAVRDANFTTPTPVQHAAIPLILQNRDVLATAQTGTGKTAAFTLPMIDRLAGGRARARMPRALILEPVRELALQVQEQVELFSAHVNLSSELFIGGVNIGPQIKQASQSIDIMIATPGRLLDLFDRGVLLLIGVEMLVIDEADRMLDMGFIPDIERIVAKLPTKRQTVMLSATMPTEVGRIAHRFLQRPARVSVAPPSAATELVDQSLIHCQASAKDRTLRSLLRNHAVETALVFCNRKRTVDDLLKTLRRDGLPVAALHGDMAQPVRLQTMDGFRNGSIRFLVATDVAGRGLDIQGISHVFNYDVPTQPEDYVHHIGRTGRAGIRGASVTLATPPERDHIQAIEKLMKFKIPVRDADASGSIQTGAAGTGRFATRANTSAVARPSERQARSDLPEQGNNAAPARRRAAPIRKKPNEVPAPEPKKLPSWSEKVGRARRQNRDSADRAPPNMVAGSPLRQKPVPRQDADTRSDRRAGRKAASGTRSFRDTEDVPAFLRAPVPLGD